MSSLPPWTGRCIFLNVTAHFTEVALMYNGKRFHVVLSLANLDDPESSESLIVKREYLRLLQTYLSEDLDNPHARPSHSARNLFIWIAEQLSHLLRDLAPKLSPRLQYMTLDDYLSPPTFYLVPTIANGNFTANYCNPNCGALIRMTKRVALPWCLFSSPVRAINPARIEVSWHPSTHGLPMSRDVVMDGNKPFYLKLPSADENVLEREAAVLLRLQETGLTEKIRVPRLHAYVQLEDDSGGVSGLLLTQIERVERLARLMVASVPLSLRRKWFDDIEVMVKLFHAAGIVWGDATAENVLVDRTDEVWIVDFAGVYSCSWTPDEEMDSVEWDLRGLAKLREFLLF